MVKRTGDTSLLIIVLRFLAFFLLKTEGPRAFNVRQVSILDDLRSDIIKARKEENRLRIMAWLSTADPSKDHNIARSKHEGTTGSWLLKLPQFQKWTVTDNSFLWMYGNGKLLISTV